MSQAVLDLCPMFWGPDKDLPFISYMLLCYFIGSIPFGIIFANYFNKKNLKEHGSGNIGATNAFRVAGKKVGVLTFLSDVLKGFFPLYLSSFFLNIPNNKQDMILIVFGLACIFGHVFSFWLKGKGGKGVSTALGTLLYINPTLLVLAILVWGIVLFISQIPAVASISVFVLLPFMGVLQTESSFWITSYLIVVSGLVIFTHRTNIKKLWKIRKTKNTH